MNEEALFELHDGFVGKYRDVVIDVMESFAKNGEWSGAPISVIILATQG